MSDQTPPSAPPGILSPDGLYRWDGSQWQPVAPPPPTAPQPPTAAAVPLAPPPGEVKKKGHLVRNLVIGVIGVFVLLIVIGIAAGGSKTGQPTASNGCPNKYDGQKADLDGTVVKGGPLIDDYLLNVKDQNGATCWVLTRVSVVSGAKVSYRGYVAKHDAKDPATPNWLEDPAVSAGAAAALSSPTPSKAPTPHAVGETITTTSGEKFTVVQYVDHFASTNQFDKPPPGGFYAAAQIKACAGTSQTLDVNPASFYLVEPDDSHIDESTSIVVGGKSPRLDSTTLQAGECVSGWVNYGVTARPKVVALSNSDLRWIVP